MDLDVGMHRYCCCSQTTTYFMVKMMLCFYFFTVTESTKSRRPDSWPTWRTSSRCRPASCRWTSEYTKLFIIYCLHSWSFPRRASATCPWDWVTAWCPWHCVTAWCPWDWCPGARRSCGGHQCYDCQRVSLSSNRKEGKRTSKSYLQARPDASMLETWVVHYQQPGPFGVSLPPLNRQIFQRVLWFKDGKVSLLLEIQVSSCFAVEGRGLCLSVHCLFFKKMIFF